MINKFKNQKLLLLIITFIISSFLIAVISLLIVHKQYIYRLNQNLYDVVTGEKSLILSLYSHNKDKDTILSFLNSANLNQLILGQTGEFVIARQNKDSITFLFFANTSKHKLNLPGSQSTKKASPIKFALSGKSGIIKSIDYKGNEVYASYTWIDELKWGLVSKIDTAEINKPYINACAIALFIAIFLISIVSFLYVRITNPVFEKIIDAEGKFQDDLRQFC